MSRATLLDLDERRQGSDVWRQSVPIVEWLDHSSAERDAILGLLAARQEKGTLDELGIGSVRDAIADHLFPPLSTIQTRAKYFLFVPWIYRNLEQGSVKDDALLLRGEQRERKLIRALLDSPSSDKAGLIGKDKPETLKRLPSSIYWSGIRRLGIFRDASSLAEYMHELDEIRSARRARRDAMELPEDPRPIDSGLTWDVGLPAAEASLLASADFEIDALQAAYLKQKTLGMETATGSLCLLQWMVLNADPATLEGQDLPWQFLGAEHAAPLPAHLAVELRHAYHFSLCIRTLTALYYRFMAEERRDLDVGTYDDVLVHCMAGLAEQADALHAWYADLPAFWQWVALTNPRLQRDRPFIERWLAELARRGFAPSDPRQLTGRELRRFVQMRERELKRELARLGNAAVLARWRAPTDVPLMDYRWSTARQFVCDVRRGLA